MLQSLCCLLLSWKRRGELSHGGDGGFRGLRPKRAPIQTSAPSAREPTSSSRGLRPPCEITSIFQAQVGEASRLTHARRSEAWPLLEAPQPGGSKARTPHLRPSSKE